MRRDGLAIVLAGVAWLAVGKPARAQVHYDPAGGSPWNQRAEAGPDAEVPGWYYNLGFTGLRAELAATDPTALVVRHVYPGSVARLTLTVPGWV